MKFKWFYKKDKRINVINSEDNTNLDISKNKNISDKNKDGLVSLDYDVPDKLGLINDDFFSKSNNFIKKKNLFDRLKKSLLKTRKLFSSQIDNSFRDKRRIDNEFLEKLEEMFVMADISIETSIELVKAISNCKSYITDVGTLKEILKKEVLKYFSINTKLDKNSSVPCVKMIVGINGVGKSSTIGKLATLESLNGKKVLIAASDTFRAAAVEQVEMYAKQAGAFVVKHGTKSDPAAVAYDGVSAALARDIDVVFIDTAGRLHTKVNLMNQLKKIKRSIKKKMINAPHEILLILDSTTGQNIINQVKIFNEFLEITGIIVTKLDGSSKGGSIIDISKRFNIPIKYITTGEGINDIQKFDPERFVEAIF